MRIDPPLRDAQHFPLTVTIGVAAIAVSGAWWMGQPADPLILEPGRIARQPWAILTSILPHVDPLHLIFNLYWWWRFATRIESAWGRGALLGVTVLLAAASNAAEYVLSDAGVGLSGVVYGLCTLLFAVRRHDLRLAGIVDQRTLQFFAAWFVLCVVLTYMGIWRVGNVAHGAGALAGWLLGLCIAAHGARRAARVVVLGCVCAVLGCAVVFGASRLNVLASEEGIERAGHWAVVDGRYAEAERLLKQAERKDPLNAMVLQTLAYVQTELKKYEDALRSCRRAVDAGAPDGVRLREIIVGFLETQALAALDADNPAEAERLMAEVAIEDPESPGIWHTRGIALEDLKHYEQAVEAYSKAIALDETLRPDLQPAIIEILQSEARRALMRKDFAAAKSLTEQALKWKPGDEYSVKLLMSIGSKGSDRGSDAVSPRGKP